MALPTQQQTATHGRVARQAPASAALRRVLHRAVQGMAALLCVAMLALATPAGAQQPSVDDQVNLLMEQGDYAGALELAQRGWGPDVPNRQARLDFIRGMKLKAEGDLQGAIAIFRELIAANPGFSRVRVELADTLYRAGDPEAASYHLRDLIRTAETDDMRRNFESYLDAIRRDRPWRISSYLSIAPSTNVNGQTTENVIVIPIPGVGCPNDLCVFVIDKGSKAKSGVGLSGGISGDYNFFLSNDFTVSLSGRLDAVKYIDNQFDKLNGRVGVHLRRKMGDNSIGGGLVADYNNIGHKTYRQAGGIELEYGRKLDSDSYLLLTTSLLYQRFPGFSIMNGPIWTTSAVVQTSLGAGQSVTTGLSFSYEHTARRYLNNRAIRMFVGHAKEWSGGLITYVEPFATARLYNGVDPTFGVRRYDIELGGRIALAHRKLSFKGFMPRIEYSYSKQFSTIIFQRRSTHSGNITLTREF